MSRTYIVGDVHGQLDKLIVHLQREVLIDNACQWCGGDAVVWFLGDFFDRGPDGIGVVDLVMRLQVEAPETGGRVSAILGNHELLISSVDKFGATRDPFPFKEVWQMNGGQENDLAAFEQRHFEWISQLPAMAIEGENLLIHADSSLYVEYGRTVDAVNEAARAVLMSDDPEAWRKMLVQFSDRFAFIGPNGRKHAKAFLHLYGAERVIHGHTPIALLTGDDPETVTRPLIYADGLCMNAEAGMYLGVGFIARLEEYI
jgi:hypothetical protein